MQSDPLVSPTDAALRLRLCLAAFLQTPHANAFHAGKLVRTAFEAAYLMHEGFVDAHAADVIHAERILCDIASRAGTNGSWQITHARDAEHIGKMLDTYEAQRFAASLDTMKRVHRLTEANFCALPQQRLSIHALLAVLSNPMDA
jgi:hypothetical protein